ncbi:MAG: VanZ family protein [Chloroherpetonaceae bacterium]
MKLFWKSLFVVQWIIFSAAIYYFSSMPKVYYLPQKILDYDKLLHLTSFFFYGISTQLFVHTVFIKMKRFPQMLLVLIIGIIYPLSDEFHQRFVPGRTSDIYDFISDLIGIILSLFLFNLILKWIDNFKESKESKDAKIS